MAGRSRRAILLHELPADSSPSRSGQRRTMIAFFLAKSRTRSTHSSLWQPSFSFVLAALSDPYGGFNNSQLNMMASEPFFYQSVLLDARRWYTEFYCIQTDTAIGRRLAFEPGHASSCTLAYGWFSLAARGGGGGSSELPEPPIATPLHLRNLLSTHVKHTILYSFV